MYRNVNTPKRKRPPVFNLFVLSLAYFLLGISVRYGNRWVSSCGVALIGAPLKPNPSRRSVQHVPRLLFLFLLFSFLFLFVSFVFFCFISVSFSFSHVYIFSVSFCCIVFSCFCIFVFFVVIFVMILFLSFFVSPLPSFKLESSMNLKKIQDGSQPKERGKYRIHI